MDNLVSETNSKLQEIVDNLSNVLNEYQQKLDKNEKDIKIELEKVKNYKEDFFDSKETIEKMNDDIDGFENDYQKLVDRFKDDELANILIAANKEISAKIEERKRKILKDKMAMNQLVEKAELSKNRLVKLTAEKKALELCIRKIEDSYSYYKASIDNIIKYSEEHKENLTLKDDSINDININEDEIALDQEVTEVHIENEYEDDNKENMDDVVNEVKEIVPGDLDLNKNQTLDENEEYKFNDNLDLESVIDFNDSIDEESEE